MSIMRTVLQSQNFVVIDHVCKHPRISCGGGPDTEPARFIFTRRGSFEVCAAGRTCLARPGQAVLLQKHVRYRISHPGPESCDCCTDVWMSDETLEMLGIRGLGAVACREFPHGLGFQQVHVEMLHALRRDGAACAAEEVLLDTFGCLLETGIPSPRMLCGSAGRRVARVEEAIVANVAENIDVAELARIAGCSPFHLCRIFRRHIGQSLRQFRLQQRLGTALDRLAEGEDDLAALACELGFSSHGHMTEAFGRAFGKPPRILREELRHAGLRRLGARLRGASSRRNARTAYNRSLCDPVAQRPAFSRRKLLHEPVGRVSEA